EEVPSGCACVLGRNKHELTPRLRGWKTAYMHISQEQRFDMQHRHFRRPRASTPRHFDASLQRQLRVLAGARDSSLEIHRPVPPQIEDLSARYVRDLRMTEAVLAARSAIEVEEELFAHVASCRSRMLDFQNEWADLRQEVYDQLQMHLSEVCQYVDERL